MTVTLVSIVPFELNEHKPGMAKEFYKIPATVEGDFTVVLIEDSHYIQRMPATDQTVKVTVTGEDIAKAIIKDFCFSHVASDIDAHPGMFYVNGDLNKAEVKLKHNDKLENIKRIQRNWFIALIKDADDIWEKYHQFSMINERQVYAAKVLKSDRPWNKDADPTSKQMLCPACKSSIHPEAIVCPICNVIIDSDKHKALKFA